jgi:predicted TIM-barrel fold metal-dependent hydrolase
MLEELVKPSAQRKTQQAFIDCDIHNYVASDAVLMHYLDPRWHNHHRTYGHRSHPVLAFHGAPYPRVAGVGKRKDATPPSGLPIGADFEFFKSHHLDAYPIEYGVLNCLSRAGDQLHEEYDAALARAINDWQRAEWLDGDERLLGSIIISYENGDLSAEEIDRVAPDKRNVQVMLKPRTKEPLGRRRYWKIYEAAVRHNLPIGVHFGGYSANPITSGGWPSFYLEDHTSMAQTFQCHLISLVCEGVFERFPTLKMVMIEGGFGWLPSLMWRMDKHWKRLASEVPHLSRKPSDIIREHIRFTTQPMEEPPKPEYLAQFFEHCGSDDMLMFATDYPHWDYDNPDRALSRLPHHLKQKVFLDNARAFYNLAPRKA